MSGRHIEENIARRLYAESMGRCMNPNCLCELFRKNGDIIERAHIDAYCKTADNSYENLVVLCPNCHTDYDKNDAFSPEEILSWKRLRKEELERAFSEKFACFDDLKQAVVPLLLENKSIFENYCLDGEKVLWDKFEAKILINNKKLKLLFLANTRLIQYHKEKAYSNLEHIRKFVLHVDEFESTRGDVEKCRKVLFPEEINSMFGIAPKRGFILPSTESLEALIQQLDSNGQFCSICLGIEHPYIQIIENGKINTVYLDDTPLLRQMYFNYGSFKETNVRLESLNFALKYIRLKGLKYSFLNTYNLREISINDTKLIFVYEYCLSEEFLRRLLPEEKSVIVNLHNWNGECCISKKGYQTAEEMNVTLLTLEDFYDYVKKIKNK